MFSDILRSNKINLNRNRHLHLQSVTRISKSISVSESIYDTKKAFDAYLAQTLFIRSDNM